MGGYEKLDGILQCAKTLMSGPEEMHSVRITPIDGIERLQPALPPFIPWVQKLNIAAQARFSSWSSRDILTWQCSLDAFALDSVWGSTQELAPWISRSMSIHASTRQLVEVDPCVA